MRKSLKRRLRSEREKKILRALVSFLGVLLGVGLVASAIAASAGTGLDGSRPRMFRPIGEPVPTGPTRDLAALAAQGTCPKVNDGINPCEIKKAYKLPTDTRGKGQTVAVVAAFDDPKAESDMGVFRKKFGLRACTTANGCFRKVNQNGGSSGFPKPDKHWAGEIVSDIEMVSSSCPLCDILLIETKGPNLADMYQGVDTAAAMKANVASLSWAGPEYATESNDDEAHFNHPGMAIAAASGDTGFNNHYYPAASKYVISVGGTSLDLSPSSPTGFTEKAWAGSGSGCSAHVSTPEWQLPMNQKRAGLRKKHCLTRTVTDVSAVASGLTMYNSYSDKGWDVWAGTSYSTPIVAGVIALAGNADKLSGTSGASYIYAHADELHDINHGSNVHGGRGTCGVKYLCTAGEGYDGPTGNGSPKGIGGL